MFGNNLKIITEEPRVSKMQMNINQNGQLFANSTSSGQDSP